MKGESFADMVNITPPDAIPNKHVENMCNSVSDNIDQSNSDTGKGKKEQPPLDTEEILNEAEVKAASDVTGKDYIYYSEEDKISLIERELLSTVQMIDINIESVNIYERKTKIKFFPKDLYEAKNNLIESKRKTLKELFDIVAHKQKLQKASTGDTFTDIIKS